MIKRFLFKVSGGLLRAHQLLEGHLKVGRRFVPYQVKYPEIRGTRKIVHCIGNFIIGGSTQLVVDIIEGTSSEYLHKIIVPKLETPLPYQPVDIQSFAISEMDKLYRWLEAEAPELVHIHFFYCLSDTYSHGVLWYETIFRMCTDLGIKVVQNVNVPTEPVKSPAVVHNVFVSKYVEEKFNYSSVEFSVIYPGSDFSHFRNDNVNDLPPKTIGMVYRLDDDKLRADAIEVFINVAKRRSDVSCIIVGGGLFLDYFKSRVSQEGLNSQIKFTGFISYKDLPSVYRKFSIFVAPVHSESFGQVTPFAMSMGQCVVGYDTGAISEILGSKETLVTVGDVPSLVQKILELLNDQKTRVRIGRENGNRARERFSVQTMVKRYQNLYAELLDLSKTESNCYRTSKNAR